MDKSLSLQGIKGCFIGSDFTFPQSKNMQEILLCNCVQETRDVGALRFQEFKPINYNVQRALINSEDDPVEEGNQIDEHVMQLVFTNFKET